MGLLNPGLIQLRQGYVWANKQRVLYSGELTSGIKNQFEMSYNLLKEIRLLFTGF